MDIIPPFNYLTKTVISDLEIICLGDNRSVFYSKYALAKLSDFLKEAIYAEPNLNRLEIPSYTSIEVSMLIQFNESKNFETFNNYQVYKLAHQWNCKDIERQIEDIIVQNPTYTNLMMMNDFHSSIIDKAISSYISVRKQFDFPDDNWNKLFTFIQGIIFDETEFIFDFNAPPPSTELTISNFPIYNA
jgi:hypothetical protein